MCLLYFFNTFLVFFSYRLLQFSHVLSNYALFTNHCCIKFDNLSYRTLKFKMNE